MGTQQFSEVTTAMRSEAERLSTFHSWPHNDKVEARKIAKAGFFHTGNNDSEVKCFWCDTVLTDWQYGDQVMARHRSANPDCPFIKNVSDNVPLLNSETSVISQTSENEMEDNEESHDVVEDLVTPMDHQSLASPSRPDTSNPANAGQQRNTTVDVVIDIAQFKAESARLQTFRNWPRQNSHIRPADLANAGFIYAGREDLVRCVFCGQYVGNWEEEDFPMTEHRALFPECPFILGRDVGNIPISHPDAAMPPLAQPGTSYDSYDETGIRPSAGRQSYSGPEKGPQNVKMTRPTTEENSGIIRHTGPQNTKYSTLEARLRSFRDWPPALKQEPRQLAEAGFYYIGFSDQTKCFYCDGGLRNWQPEDDPWTEHARWFSKCGFVRLVKGDEFISKCMEERPPESLAPEISKNPRTPTDEEIKSLMSSTVVQQVLSMGVDASRIKSALKRQILKNGQPFSDPNSLVSAALKTDCEAERRPVSLGGAESHQSLSQTQTPNVVVLEQPSQPERSVSAPGPSTAPVPATSSTASTASTQMETAKPEISVDLEQENRLLKEARICKICMDQEIGVVFLPCGHLI